jgi:hypothetical protein
MGSCRCGTTDCSSSTFCNSQSQCAPLWSTLSTTSEAAFDPRFTAAWNGNIYVGNAANEGSGAPEYFVKFATTTSSWSPLPTTTDLCECGYVGALVATSAGLGYAGNAADIFNGSTWASLPFSTADERGAACFATLGSVMYELSGGILSYDLAQGTAGTWNANWPSPPMSFSSCCAAADPATNTIYVFSGLDSTGTYAMAFNVSTMAWTALPSSAMPPTPCGALTPSLAQWSGRLFFAADYLPPSLVEFDLSTKTWSTGSVITTNTNQEWTTVVADATGLYAVGYDTTGTIVVSKYNGY